MMFQMDNGALGTTQKPLAMPSQSSSLILTVLILTVVAQSGLASCLHDIMKPRAVDGGRMDTVRSCRDAAAWVCRNADVILATH